MSPELGHFALILALIVAALQGLLPFIGAYTRHSAYLHVARPAALCQFALILLSFACLMWGFYQYDFSIAYVANHSNRLQPLWYRLAAVWGGHEGSLLLWVCELAGWGALVALFSRRLDVRFRAQVLGVLGALNVGFLWFMLATSNPFLRFLPNVPLDGLELNPLLQDPGLVSHPPMLYMGYVGFAVAFAFAIAALIEGRLDAIWARWVRPWTLAAWCFLSLGILLGSIWAYHELGWGGWWFWDPVENASFMPWLVGTALLHSLMVVEKRETFKAWTALLAIAAFSLCLLGTFIVRSGVVISVHAFAQDPSRGLFILRYLVLVIGGALVLYAWRGSKLKGDVGFAMVSRETALLLNNVILLVAMVTVLLGTLYPLFIDALGLGKLSVGAPYFNLIFIPLMSPLMVLMGAGPLCFWRDNRGSGFAKRFLALLCVAIAVSVICLLAITHGLPLGVLLGVSLSVWVIIATLLRTQAIIASGQGMNLNAWAMAAAHIGVAICALGIVNTTHFSQEQDAVLSFGESAKLASYQVQFVKTEKLQGENYEATRGTFLLSHGGKPLGTLQPEKRFYVSSKTTMTESAIYKGFFTDVYLVLAEKISDSRWAVRLYYKPFVRWIWGGGFLMLLGGLLGFAAKLRQGRKV